MASHWTHNSPARGRQMQGSPWSFSPQGSLELPRQALLGDKSSPFIAESQLYHRTLGLNVKAKDAWGSLAEIFGGHCPFPSGGPPAISLSALYVGSLNSSMAAYLFYVI